MYLNHFGLQLHPFRLAPEDDFVYMSQQHSRAFVYMDSTVWSPESFVVVSGEVGSGKTTLLKKLIRGLNPDLRLIHVAYTNLGSADLFQMLAHQAGINTDDSRKITLLFAIEKYLQEMSNKEVPVVLAVDEAQNLTRENLEDIRMLAGLEGERGPMMRVILLGQPELRDNIHAIPQLAQRIKLFFHLTGLSESEVGEYIQHRLHVAGFRGQTLFDERTVRRIHELSNGIPRLINKLCDGLMLCAYAEDRPNLNGDDLEELKHELLSHQTNRSKTVDTVSTGSNELTGLAEKSVDTYAALESVGKQAEALQKIAIALEQIEVSLSRLLSDDGHADSGGSDFKGANNRTRTTD